LRSCELSRSVRYTDRQPCNQPDGAPPHPTLASVPALNSGHRDTRATAWFGGDPMFDLLYVILIIVLLAISIAMIRFFERL
jgi:hypothetical protein